MHHPRKTSKHVADKCTRAPLLLLLLPALVMPSWHEACALTIGKQQMRGNLQQLENCITVIRVYLHLSVTFESRIENSLISGTERIARHAAPTDNAKHVVHECLTSVQALTSRSSPSHQKASLVSHNCQASIDPSETTR